MWESVAAELAAGRYETWAAIFLHCSACGRRVAIGGGFGHFWRQKCLGKAKIPPLHHPASILIFNPNKKAVYRFDKLLYFLLLYYV